MINGKLKKRTILFLTMALLFISGSALADSPMVTIEASEVIERDKFVGAQSIRNEGTIQGDLIFGARDLWSTGTVTGDIIGVGSEIAVNGPVLGNVRIAGGIINLSAKVGKNSNLFGGTINLKEAEIGGNLLVFGEKIDINGTVKGYTHIEAENTVLKGEFFGDVDINTYFPDELKEHHRYNPEHESTLTVLSGTVIHGTLKYHGLKLDLAEGAKIGNVDWVKPTATSTKFQRRELTEEIWGLIRLLFGTGVYFLFGWAFYKLFPVVFSRQGEIIAAKPLNVIGAGLIGLVSTLASMVVFVVLLIFSFLINPGIGLIFGTAMTLGYILLFYFSTIPVALWLGNLFLKKNLNVSYRFGVGLATITIGLYILKFLAKLPVVGPVFPALKFMAVFGVLIMGVGALLYGAKFLIATARKGEQTLIND